MPPKAAASTTAPKTSWKEPFELGISLYKSREYDQALVALDQVSSPVQRPRPPRITDAALDMASQADQPRLPSLWCPGNQGWWEAGRCCA